MEAALRLLHHSLCKVVLSVRSWNAQSSPSKYLECTKKPEYNVKSLLIIQSWDASRKLEDLWYWRHDMCPPKAALCFRAQGLIQSTLESFHSYRLGINCWQNSNPQYSQDSLQHHANLPQTAKHLQLFPSVLSNVQAQDLFSTGGMEEGIFISKEGRAGTVTI